MAHGPLIVHRNSSYPPGLERLQRDAPAASPNAKLSMSRQFTPAILRVILLYVLLPCSRRPSAADALVADTQDVHILDVRRVDTRDTVAGLASRGAAYLIVSLRFTNDTGADIAPRIDHFVFTASNGGRYFGLDSGSTALVGISNDRGIVKMNASREYTVGFRTDTVLGGTIAYEVTD